MKENLNRGTRFLLCGPVESRGGRLQLMNPSLEKENRIVPLYRPIEGLPQRVHEQIAREALESLDEVCPETLPLSLVKRYVLLPLGEALRRLHAPRTMDEVQPAQRRLAFEQMLMYQAGIRMMRRLRRGGLPMEAPAERQEAFWASLPFSPTSAQRRTLAEIARDMELKGSEPYAMARMVQGDVGSGKTLVALMSMLLACDNGFQACLMAPTEILASQHYASIVRMTEGIGLRVGLLTGSTKKKERAELSEGLLSGEIDILIGTHALIENGVRFRNLGFVVIDEQHRFGVEQRARLWSKNLQAAPHVLVMTATPIPRTLAMTLYGDLDVSVIDELPPGRKPVKTVHYRDSHRLRVFGFIRDEIKRGRQVYVVYPLIKESEKMDYKDLEDGYAGIVQAFPPPEYVTVVVHGKMKAADKEYGMDLFKRGVAHIMVATSVIEVGVDVPNASIIVIESAERFGLSQLHQLRGRVGRGAEQSYCILMSGDKLSAESRKRLGAMVQTTDGFRLAEMDLQLRGPGDLSGTLQSGLAFDLKIASLGRDGQILSLARSAAERILEQDPHLERNTMLKELSDKYNSAENADFSMIS